MASSLPSQIHGIPVRRAPSSFFALMEASQHLPSDGPFLGVAGSASWWSHWGEIQIRDPRLLLAGPMGAMKPTPLSSQDPHAVDSRVLRVYAALVEGAFSVPGGEPGFDFGDSSEMNGTDPRALWILPDVALFLDTIEQPTELLEVDDIFPRCGIYHRPPSSAHDALQVHDRVSEAADLVQRLASTHYHTYQSLRASRR